MSGDRSQEQLDTRLTQERAVEWIVDRHLAEAWSDQDQTRLDAWLSESPTHLVAYWRAKDSWNRTELLAALRSFRSDRDDKKQKSWGPWRRRAAVAAIIVIAGATGAAYFFQPAEHRYATALGGRQTLALADGSQIEMNTDTALRVSETGNRRTVTLEKGEAFFQIKHDGSRPFVVDVANQRITDLGTKFSIRADDGRVQVAVVEGLARIETVGVEGLHSFKVLKPGDVAIATMQSISVSETSQAALSNQLAWRRGVLVFDNTPLVEVAAEFNRYNRQKIVIADQSASRRTINGAFQANDLEAMTNIAREVFGLRVEQGKNEILISR